MGREPQARSRPSPPLLAFAPQEGALSLGAPHVLTALRIWNSEGLRGSCVGPTDHLLAPLSICFVIPSYCGENSCLPHASSSFPSHNQCGRSTKVARSSTTSIYMPPSIKHLTFKLNTSSIKCQLTLFSPSLEARLGFCRSLCCPASIQTAHPSFTGGQPYSLPLCLTFLTGAPRGKGPGTSSLCLSSNPWTPQELGTQLLLYNLSLQKVWDFGVIPVFLFSVCI